jgi:SAM-dependent methyltransferase
MNVRYALKIMKNTWLNARIYISSGSTVNEVPEPRIVSHSKWTTYLEREFNKEGMSVLEIGARVVTGSCFRPYFLKAKYIGFDFYPDQNVDVVGDAHKLATYFHEDEKFDLIFSTAVFEHLHMPWVVAQEIHKLLKVGGFVFVETVFSFSSHERPWNFFQFSDVGLRALFNKAMGFELIDSGMSNPMGGYFGGKADAYLRYLPIGELYCHSGILCKKIREVCNFEWIDCDINDIVDSSRYPPPVDEKGRIESVLHWTRIEKANRLSFICISYRVPILFSIMERRFLRLLTQMEFDEEFYLDLNPDVREEQVDAKIHFLRYGRRENRKYRFSRIALIQEPSSPLK